MRLAVQHETLYAYSAPFFHTIQQLRLTPRIEPDQTTLDWQIQAPAPLDHSVDGFGNQMHTFTLAKQASQIRVVAGGIVETKPLMDGRLREPSGHVVAPMAFIVPTWYTEANAALAALGRAHLGLEQGRGQWLALAHGVGEAIQYTPKATQVSTTAADAIALGKGVCQDQAHVYIAACHALGVPCRYVSGYFYPGAKSDLASHAWVDVWDAHENAWFSVDVTHACWASERYIRLAIGRDYETAAPVRGVRTGGGDERLKVNVRVTVSR